MSLANSEDAKFLESKFLTDIKNACKDQMKINSVLASVTAAQAIYESNWGTTDYCASTNNLFRVLVDSNWTGKCYSLESKKMYVSKNDYSGTDTLIKVYNTYSQCIEDRTSYIITARKSSNGPFKYRNIVGITDYKKCINMYVRDGYLKDQLNDYKDPKYESVLIALVEKYKLYEWDNDIINGGTVSSVKIEYSVKMSKDDIAPLLQTLNIQNAEYVAGNNRGYKVFDGSNTLITDPWVVNDSDPMFRVRLSWDKQDTQLVATKILEDAKDTAKRHTGYKVFDSNGNIVYDPWSKEPTTPASNISHVVIVRPGDIVILDNTPVYRSYDDKNPFTFLTGKFYYYDSKIFNNRARITTTNDPKYINGKDPSKITGIIKVK